MARRAANTTPTATPTMIAVNVLRRKARPRRMPLHSATPVSVTSSANPASHSADSAIT
jgi:hypothetical protein